MGRHYSNAIILFFVLLITSCAFDPPEGKLQELGGDYYLSYDSHSPNDGLKIVYTKDKELLKVVASNCLAIYRDSNLIVFSKSLFEGDTTNKEYFQIYLNSKSEVEKINNTTYNRKITGLKKIDFRSNN